jgi:hypothetical protein
MQGSQGDLSIQGESVLKQLSLAVNNKTSVFLLVLALIVGGVGAQATGVLNTKSGGYLVCVNSKTKVVTHPGTSTCPKGSKKLVLGAQGIAGVNGLTGAAGLPGKNGKDGKDGKTLWNGTTDPISTLGAPGDMFINSVTKTLFGPKNLDGTWPIGVSMVGPAGERGPIGLTGAIGPQGPGGGSGPAGPAGPAGSNATLTCAQGGTCVVGNTGPGGGIVFYVQTATDTAPWRYMEAAPNTWSGFGEDWTTLWCNSNEDFLPNLIFGNTGTIHTSSAIGAGFRNTRMMVQNCGFGAANAAAAYNGGGKSDWFLPSKDELNLLYGAKATVGGFQTNCSYWSSSEKVKDDAWVQTFPSGQQGALIKQAVNCTRPVRAFG